MTGRSIGLSLVAHALLLAVVLDRGGAPPPPASPPGTPIEIVDLPAPPPAPAPAVHRTAAPRGAMHRGVAGGRPARAPERRAGGLAIAAEVRGGEGSGGGEGDGGGTGDGGGPGLGWSPPAGAAPPPPPPAEVAAPARSKARPARLIFPKKHRTAEDGPVFTARLDVDAEGYVVGVRLLRGVGGRRDQVAEREVWRFRYDPARDDRGRPIRSRVEQRFMLD